MSYFQKISTLIRFCILVFCITTPQVNADTSSALSAYSIFANYYRSEPVTFGVKNQSNLSITLPNSAPWYVVNRTTGETVYQPISLPVLIDFPPGESKVWVWDQKDNAGRQVKPGSYSVVSKTLALSVDFNIRLTQGSVGFFTFRVLDETFRVLMTNPYSIRDAINNYYGLNDKSIPIGDLVDDRPGQSPYDGQWSWHMDSSSVAMTENAIEVCDGTLSFVEKNLDYWVKDVGYYCPWGARVISLE